MTLVNIPGLPDSLAALTALYGTALTLAVLAVAVPVSKKRRQLEKTKTCTEVIPKARTTPFPRQARAYVNSSPCELTWFPSDIHMYM